MITVGTDVHKATHTFVAVDVVGSKIGTITVSATTAGHAQALGWARALSDAEQMRWAIEDCRNMSGRLERDLLAAGQSVVRVAPHLMAAHRRTGRERGKSDPIDALAVARAAQREPDLPVACHDEVTRELKMLTDHRDHYVAQRTSLINRVLWTVHELDPEHPTGSLTALTHQHALTTWLQKQPGLAAELAAELVAEITTATERINKLTTRVHDAVAQMYPTLLTIDGCGALTAAKIAGETANIDRFATDSKFARYCGIAPVPVWSGRTFGAVRLTRSGNRQLNRAIHTIALTQIRIEGTAGHAYYLKKIAEGKTKKAALRCLKRKIVRTAFEALRTDYAQRTTDHLEATA